MTKEDQCSPLHDWCDPINESGLMYRTQYLVLSRTLLEAMPKEWQHRFVDLLGEIEEEFNYMHDDWSAPHYRVKAVDDKGRYIKDPWGNYRYPDSKWIDSLRNK